jgi:hypothetical protein
MPGSVKEASADSAPAVTVKYDVNSGDSEVSLSYKNNEPAPATVEIQQTGEVPDLEWSPTELPDATRRGYRFIGWYSQQVNGDPVGDRFESYSPERTVPAGTVITLYAYWEPVQLDEGRLVVESKETVDGTPVALTYDGTVKTPRVTVYDENGNQLNKSDYELLYKANSSQEVDPANPKVYYPYGLVGDGENGGKAGVVYGYTDATDSAEIYIGGKGDYKDCAIIQGEFQIEKRKVAIVPVQENGVRFDANPEVYKYDLNVTGLTDTFISKYMTDTIKILSGADAGRKVFVSVNKTDPANPVYTNKELLRRDSATSSEVGEYSYDISLFEADPVIGNNFELSINPNASYIIEPYSFTGNEDKFEVTLSQSEYVYNGTKRTPTVTVNRIKDNKGDDLEPKTLLVRDTDYTIEEEGSEGTEPDDYIIKINGIDDYTGTLTKSWKIIKKTYDPSLSYNKYYQFQLDGKNVVPDAGVIASDIVYDGKDHVVSINTVDPEDNAGDSVDIDISYCDTENGEYKSDAPVFRNAGTHTVYYKIDFKNHYNTIANPITGSVSFTIAKKQISLRVKSANKFYGDNDPEYEYAITSGKMVTGETIDPVEFRKTIRRTNKNNANPDTIPVDISNYKLDGGEESWINDYEQVGSYKLSFNEVELETVYKNYDFTDSSQDEQYNSVLTIKKKAIKVEAVAKEKEYLAPVPEFTYNTFVTTVNNEGVSTAEPYTLPFADTLKGSLECKDKSADPQPVGVDTPVGRYDIAKGTLASNNFTISYTKAVLEIKPINISELPSADPNDSTKAWISVEYVDDGNGNTKVFPYNDAYHEPKFNIVYHKGDVAKGLGVKTDYNLGGDTKKKDMGYYTVTIKGDGNYSGEISRNWLIAVPAETGLKTATYTGKVLSFESFAETGKLKFPAGSKVYYNCMYQKQDVPAAETSQGTDTNLTNLGFNYVYIPDENGYPSDYDEKAPELKYAGNYTVYYKVVQENKPTLYFSFNFKINKKKVVLVAANKEMTYGSVEPEKTIRAILYNADNGYYANPDNITGLQNAASALYSGESVIGYKVVRENAETPLDVKDGYELSVVEKPENELTADEKEDIAKPESFVNNYEVMGMYPGKLTVNKADYDFGTGDINGLVTSIVEASANSANPIATPAPIASNQIGKEYSNNKWTKHEVTYLKELMTCNAAVALGFKSPVYTDNNEPLAPIVYTGSDTSIIQEGSVTISDDGVISFLLSNNAKAGRDVTLNITVGSKNYNPIVVPVTIRTKKNQGMIKVKEVVPPAVEPAFKKVYDGNVIPIVEDNLTYLEYFDIEGMKYDSSIGKDVYEGETGYTPAEYNALGYNISFKYYKYDDSQQNNKGDELTAAPKNAGKYVIEAILAESVEYTSDTKYFEYTIDKKDITIPLSESADKQYDGKADALIPAVKVTAEANNAGYDDGLPIKGESFEIRGLTGTYKASAEANADDDPHVSYEDFSASNPVPKAKPVKLNDNYASNVKYEIVPLSNSKIDSANDISSDKKSLVNYNITFNTASLVGKILPKELTIKVPALTNDNRVYNGSAAAAIPNIVVTADGADNTVATGVEGEYFKIKITDAKYQAVNGIPAEDVLLNNNVPAAKPIKIEGTSVVETSTSVAVTDSKLVDYKIIFDESELTGVIKKKPITIAVPGDYSKVYDGTDVVRIGAIDVPDSVTEVEGETFRINGLTGAFQNSSNGVDAKDVVLNSNGEPAAKPITIVNPYLSSTNPDDIQGYSVESTSTGTDKPVVFNGIIPRNYEITFNDQELTGVITKKPIQVNVPLPSDKTYDGTDVAKIPDIEVADDNLADTKNKAIKGEAFKITGLIGRFEDKNAKYSGDEPQPKAVTFIEPYSEFNMSNETHVQNKNLVIDNYRINVEGSKATTYGTEIPRLTNYELSFNIADQSNYKAKILKKELKITVPSPAPRDYDGTNVVRTFPDTISVEDADDPTAENKAVKGEKFDIYGFKGTYTSTSVEPKDVLLDNAGEPMAKNIVLDESGIHYGKPGTSTCNIISENELENYKVTWANYTNPGDIKGIIKKKDITVKLQNPDPRAYNGTNIVYFDPITIAADSNATTANKAIEGESFTIKGLKGNYEGGKDAGENKNITIVNPYDDIVPFASIADYSIEKATNSDIDPVLADTNRKSLRNYNITFDEGEGQNHLKGTITQKKINITADQLKFGDKPYDGTDIAKFDDIVIAAGDTPDIANKAIAGETFTLTGLTGKYKDITNPDKTIAGKDVYINNEQVTAKEVLFNNPNADTYASLDDKYKGFQIKVPEGSNAELAEGKLSELKNYKIVFPTNAELSELSGKIVPKQLKYNITAEDKEYDGKTDATLKVAFDNKYEPVNGEGFDVDALTASFVGTFEDKNVAYIGTEPNRKVADKEVTVALRTGLTKPELNPKEGTGTVTLADNYDIAPAEANTDNQGGYANVKAKINPKTVYLITEIADKEYDGTTSATVSSAEIYHSEPGVTEPGATATAAPTMVPGTGVKEVGNEKEEKIKIKIQEASFDDANVAYTGEGVNKAVADKPVSVLCELDPYSITGTDVDNYKIVYGYEETSTGKLNPIFVPEFKGKAKINPKKLTAVYASEDKLYDGKDDATVSATVNTDITGETLTITGLTGKFVSKDASTDKIKVEVNSTNKAVTPNEVNTKADNYVIDCPQFDTDGALINKRDVQIKAIANPATIDYDKLNTVTLSAEIKYKKDGSAQAEYVDRSEINGFDGDVIKNIEVEYATTDNIIPGNDPYVIKVKDQTDVTAAYPNYNITYVPGAVTVTKSDGPAAPSKDIVTIVRPVDQTTANGVVTLDFDAPTTLQYRYKVSENDWTQWNSVAADGKITGLKATTLELRVAATSTHNAGEALEVTITAKDTQAKPTTVKAHKASSANANDGYIDGLDATMEYSFDGFVTEPTIVGDNQTSVTGLASGTNVSVRFKETNDKRPGEAWTATIGTKTNMATPDVSDITMVKATSDKVNDGKMIVPQGKTGLEYSIDNGTTWSDIEPTEVTGLPVGAVLVRTKTTDVEEYNPSESVKLIVGNLEVDKKAAKEAIDDEAATITAQIGAYAFKKLSQTDINGYKNDVTTQATNGKTAVDNATTVAGVDEKKQAAIKAIDDVFAAAKAKDDIDALNAAKEEAVNAIDSEVKAATTAIKALTYLTVNQQNTYIEAIVKEGDNDTIFEKGKAQINAANTIEDVKTEKEATLNNIAGKLSEAKAANLTSAKTKANTSVESSATTANTTIDHLNLLTPEEKSSYIGQVNTIAERFKAQIAAVTEPTTLAYTNITQYETDAKTAITNVVTTAKGTELNKAKQKAKEVVNAAKESAITAIDAMTKLSADEIAGFKAQITSTDVDTAIVEVALNAIDAAATPDAATNAGRDAKAAIEAVVKNAQDKDVDNARTEANDAVDAKALEAKIAIQALKNLKPEDITGYIESIDKENTTGTIVAAAKAAIAAATTVADVGAAKDDAIDKIAKKVEDAKEADLAAAKKAAKDDVEAARNTANNAINALNEGLEPDTELVTEAERNSYKAQVSQIEVNFKDKIGAITDPDKVNDIATFKEAAVKAIQDVVTTAQKDALKKAKDSAEQIIDYYKLSAFKEIEDLPNLSDEEKKTYKESIFKENDTNCIVNAQLSIVENSDIVAVVINAAYDAFDAIEEVINNAKAADVLKKAKEDAEAVVITAKNAAVDAIKELTKLSDAEKADFTARITKTGVDTAIAEAALKAINNAATPEAATKAGSDAKTNIEAVVKEAQDKDVANAKDAAIKAINAKVTEAKAVIGGLKNLEATEITKYIDTIDKENTNDTIVAIGKAAIDAATKVADIDKAKEDTIDNIDAEIVKAKNADLTAAKEAAAKIVADAKTEADTEINALTLLTTEEKSSYSGQLKGIADSFKAKTEAVTDPKNVGLIAGYADDAVTALENVVTTAQSTELKKAKENAASVVNTAKAGAFDTINALQTLSKDEKAAYTDRIYKENDADNIVNAALDTIDKAATVGAAAAAGTEAVADIQAVVNAAKAAEALKKAKEDAETVVNTAKTGAVDAIKAMTKLSDTEKAEFTGRITKEGADTALAEAALKAIKNAETPEAATKAGSDAKAAIEAVVTEAQGKDIDNAKNAANKAVDDKVSEAETVIQALINLVSDSKTELIEKIVKEGSKDTIEAKGKAAISAATSADKVDEARNAAIAEIDAAIAEAKNSDLTAGKAAAKQAVGDVKAEANDAIESLAPILTSDEINAYLNQISKIEENFTTKTDAVTVDKVGDIIKYTDEAITAINEVAVIADSVYLKKAKADSKKVINDAVLEGKETVKQLNSLSDTEKGDYYEAIEMAANEGNSSIDAVATSDKLGDIVTAKLDAVDAINKTVEDAKAANTLNKGKADAIAIVNTAKDSAIAAINELDNLSDDEKKAYTDSIFKANGGNATANFAISMIQNADTADKAIEAANTAKTAIETIAEKAMADDALKKAKADATTVINTAKENALNEISELTGLTEEEQTKFADSVASSVNGSMGMLQNADTPAKASGIANGAKSGIENIVKNAKAQSALNAAKEEAKNSLSSDLLAAAVVMSTLDDLSEEEASEYLNRIAAENDPEAIFNAATKAIAEADTADKAKEAANTAHNAINDIMIEAQAKNMANAKQTAVGAVNSAVSEAADTINALNNLSADDKKAIIDGIGNKDSADSLAGMALSGIDNAVDESDAKKISAECVTAIEAEVDKAVKADLNKAKENAKNEILASKEAAEKAIDETEGLTAKEKASYKALINSNTESAIKAIDKVTQSSEIADITEEVTGVNEVIAKAKDDSSLDAAKNIAAKAIKSEADKAVDSISDMKYLSDSAKKEFKDKISAIDADNAVEPATTAEKINENADAAKANINKIIADAKTANLNAAKTQATEEVNDKGDKAKEDINSLSELPDDEAEGYTEKVDELTEAAENAIAGITDPDKADEVITKKDEAVTAINEVVKEAEDRNKELDKGTEATPTPSPTTDATTAPSQTPMASAAPSASPAADNSASPSSSPIPGTVNPTAAPNPLKAADISALSLNKGLKVSQKGKKITVKWGKVTGATKYKVFAQYCGKAFSKDANATRTVASATIKKINGKALDLKKNYKVVVKAYKGNKELGKTIVAHIVGVKNTKYTNVNGIDINSEKNIKALEVGSTSTIEAETNLVDDSKLPLSNAHAKEFRYASSNPSVAKVNGSGKITAVATGKCTIYVYARNGFAEKVSVTVP